MKISSNIVVSSLAWVAICLVVAAWPSLVSAEDQIASSAASAHPLTKSELTSIYQDKTWHWKDGAAYFGAKKQAFKAWLNKGAESNYADGDWSVSDEGNLCYHATWYAIGGHSTTSTCFQHRQDEKNIYQRKLPNGQWYVFSHLPAVPGDEILKLESGDRTADNFQDNKRYVAKHSGEKKKK